MSSCNRCGNPLPRFFDSICQKCESIEREREEDREREDEREEQAAKSREQSREDMAAAVVYIADAKNNPGDYNCPHCKFRTLKRGASRCASCHGEPGSQYWVDIETKERDARLRALVAEDAAREEWVRTAPARAAAARAAVAIKKYEARWGNFWFYLLPLISTGTYLLILYVLSLGKMSLDDASIALLIMAIPILNWIGLIFVLFSPTEYFIACIIFWIIMGGILQFVTKPKSKVTPAIPMPAVPDLAPMPEAPVSIAPAAKTSTGMPKWVIPAIFVGVGLALFAGGLLYYQKSQREADTKLAREQEVTQQKAEESRRLAEQVARLEAEQKAQAERQQAQLQQQGQPQQQTAQPAVKNQSADDAMLKGAHKSLDALLKQ